MSRKPPVQGIPAHIVTGPLGAGKTTLIRELLAQRPAGERWAVLVNEFGEIGIDDATVDEADGIAVASVPGGCICCTARTQLGVALTGLLRRERPDRLLIEPTGLGHPAGIVDILRGEGLREAVSPGPHVTVVDPRTVDADRLARSRTLADQLELADVVVLSHGDDATAAERAFIEDYLTGLYPPKAAVITADHGRVDPTILQADHVDRPLACATDHDPHDHHDAVHERLAGPPPFERVVGRGLGHRSTGWLFDPDVVFDRAAVVRLLEAHADRFDRAKGVLHTDRAWLLFDLVGGEVDVRPVAHRRDSRFEVIAADDVDPYTFEAGLLAAVRPA